MRSKIKVTGSPVANRVGVLDLMGTHSFTGDLVVSLASPSGASAQLFANICRGAEDFYLSFGDQAASAPACPPTGGQTWKPDELLWPLTSGKIDGDWTLELRDVGDGDTGTLEGWKLLLCDLPRLSINGCGAWEGSALAAGEAEEFDLVLDSGRTIDLTTDGVSGCPGDTVLELYAADGTLLADDDDGGPGICSRIRTTLDAGSYVVRVAGWFGSPVGAYLLHYYDDTCTECGDGTLDPTEECDDGNLADGDGCSATCTLEIPDAWTCPAEYYNASDGCDCGCAVVDPDCASGASVECDFHFCDLELPRPDDNSLCYAPACGDGLVDALAGEACDDGEANSDASGHYCRVSCSARACGQPVSTGASPTSTDALYSLRSGVGLEYCDAEVCDVNGNGANTASDALAILQAAVDIEVTMACPGSVATLQP